MSDSIGERGKAALPDAATLELARETFILVGPSPRRPLSLSDTARRLAVTPRTLQRRLRAAGISYRGLVDHMRKQRAIELLTTTALGMEAVAADVGFSDAAAFHRAFRRWMGVAPGHFRRLAAPQADGVAIPAPPFSDLRLPPSG